MNQGKSRILGTSVAEVGRSKEEESWLSCSLDGILSNHGYRYVTELR